MSDENALREALAGLVGRLDEIHADPAYQSVWVINQTHAGPYCGPTYTDALARARVALAGNPPPTTEASCDPQGGASP